MTKKFALFAGLVAGIVIAGIVARKYFKKTEVEENQQAADVDQTSCNDHERQTVVILTPEHQAEVEASVLNPRFKFLVDHAIPVPFHSSWNNDTGYFNGVLSDKNVQSLANGLYSFTSDNERRGLIIRQDADTHVLFQRYSDDKSYLACNTNAKLNSTECIENLFYIAEAMWQEIERAITATHSEK